MYVFWLFFVFLCHTNSMPSDFGSILSFNDSWYSGKSMIHSSSRRFKANDIENSVFLLDRLSPLDGSRGLQYCRRQATCQPLPKGSTCLGAKLPYNSSTLELVPVLVESQQQMLDHFAVWKGLIHLPRCWAVIQPFLCSLYMPKCENDLVDLPSEEMCKVILGPCRILTEQNAWPLALKCDNNTDFPSGCKNDVREIKFNSSGRCQEPMVATNSPSSYYEEMETCGVQCDNPMFTADERFQIHRLVAWAATICLLFNLFTVVTFMIDWSSSQYPALITFYINLCFLIVCLGWLAQFLPGGREDIVCRKDGTLRIGEPNARENLSCVVVFVLVYYFLMAGIVWFVIFTYAYHISFQSLGKIFPGRAVRMDKKGAYFHLVAWSLPLVLTITTMALGEIDGDSVTGVCFVGSVNHVYRGILLLLPVFSALSIGGYFLFKGLIKLIAIQITSQEVVSVRATAKIRETIVRWGFFSVLIFIFGFVSFVCHIYKFRNSSLWDESFKKYIVCKLVYSTTTECRQEARPSLAILQLQVLALFATGIAMSSWVWTNSTWQTWKRFFARLTNKKTEEAPVKLIKHKVIAQAFAKRKMLNSAGRLSISIHSSYQDPVGLNFELNSMASGNLSSTWAAALPKLVTRRGALAGVTNSNSSQRRNSMDSEISYSVRRVSVESRRHSLDSAVSVQVAELTKTVRKARPSHRHRVRGRRRRRSRAGSRRGSSTSQDSQGDAQILQALTIGGVDIPPVSSLVHNQSRRQAIAGLDDNLDILAVKLFGNLAGPLGLSNSSDGSSEEVTQVRETLITGRFQTNTNTNTISGYSDDEKAAEEEDEVDSDDVTQLLTKSYKNKRDCDVQISKISSRSNKSEVENEREIRNKKRESEGRNSKLSNKSNMSDTSRQTCDGQVDERSNRSELKREKATYPSCSDLENCTDDAKWIQSEGEGKGSSRKINVSVATNCSLIPEQLNYTYQSASTVSVGSHPQHGREIGTQTNVSFNNKDRSASTCSKPKRKKSNASRNKPSSTDSSLK